MSCRPVARHFDKKRIARTTPRSDKIAKLPAIGVGTVQSDSTTSPYPASEPTLFAPILSAPILSAPILSAPILSASASDATRFDASCVACPVVLPPSVTGTSKWQCYYYGNAGCWANGAPSALSTGWIGLAESDDGVRWTKVAGSDAMRSVLAPTGNDTDWDGIHVGVGDVVRVSGDELHMYYFGGGGEKVSLMGEAERAGLRMRIGRAASKDNGRTWKRLGISLDYDEKEGLFVTMPRLMIPVDSSKPWRMIYHAFNGKRHSAFGATSHDNGKTWTRDGKILGPGCEGSWDEMGVGCRSVMRRPNGEWIMVYEAADERFTYRLGVAHLKENDDGSLTCIRAGGSEFSEPGGPILHPGKHPLGPWTSQLVGTPYLVGMEDGSVRLYFCSKTTETSHSIGLVISDTGEMCTCSWRAPSPVSYDAQ